MALQLAVFLAASGAIVWLSWRSLASSVMLKDDGTVWAMKNINSPYPDPPPPPAAVQIGALTGVKAVVAAPWDNILAIQTDGTVWHTRCWNCPANPNLRQVEGLSGIAAVASGIPANSWEFSVFNNLALGSDGRVWRFESPQEPPVPAHLIGELDHIIAIAAGTSQRFVANHSLALMADGTVWSWGLNANGQLGDGTTISRTNAARVQGLTGVVSIAAGADYSVAVRNDGSVWAWGANERGQLGDGTTVTRKSPMPVARLGQIQTVSARLSHTLAVDRDGAVWTWGETTSGQLGDSRALIQATPVQVIPPGAADLELACAHPGDFIAGAQGLYTLTVTNIGAVASSGAPPGIRSFAAGTTMSSHPDLTV